jgi:hypothetical protein
MKNTLIILSIFFFAACQNTASTVAPDDTTVKNDGSTINVTGLTLIVEGNFMSANNYTVSGKVKIYEDKDKKRQLNFEDFKTTSGPDLKIYLAEDLAAKNFVEISNDVKNGSKAYSLDNKINIGEKKQVLIWCKQFSRLFGSAELK